MILPFTWIFCITNCVHLETNLSSCRAYL